MKNGAPFRITKRRVVSISPMLASCKREALGTISALRIRRTRLTATGYALAFPRVCKVNTTRREPSQDHH